MVGKKRHSKLTDLVNGPKSAFFLPLFFGHDMLTTAQAEASPVFARNDLIWITATAFVLLSILLMVLFLIFKKLYQGTLSENAAPQAYKPKQTGSPEGLVGHELDQILDNASSGILVIQKDFKIIRVNQSFNRMVGREGEDLLGRKCFEVMKGPFCDTECCPLTRIQHGEIQINTEFTLFRKDGTTLPCILRARAYHNPNGEFAGIIQDFADISIPRRTERALMEKEEYLRNIMESMDSGLIISDGRTHEVEYANPYACRLLGVEEVDLIGHTWDEFLLLDYDGKEAMDRQPYSVTSEDCILKRSDGRRIRVRRSVEQITAHDKKYYIQTFFDISDFKKLLEAQQINIDKAMRILSLINNRSPRCIMLSNGNTLFFEAITSACQAVGGDHYFLRNVPANSQYPCGRSMLSLKDQSGHEVNCVLRSIAADLYHNATIQQHPGTDMAEILNQLNRQICETNIFEDDAFFTSINLDIDHQNLLMNYISCGHPNFLVIRNNEVISLPKEECKGQNLPMGFTGSIEYHSGYFQLEPGDKLILYTDGLTEMPLRKKGFKLSVDDLAEQVNDILNDHPVQAPVNHIIRDLLKRVCKLAGENVVPFKFNTSDDDVTILGMEIESDSESSQQIIRPQNRDDIEQAIDQLCETISEKWTQDGFKGQENRIRCVLEEALLNAWYHGNHEDPSKEIVVRWRHINDFHLEVIDQGNGFDHENLPDPTEVQNLLLENGRGLYMIRMYGDYVHWLDQGRRIVISFRAIDPHDRRRKLRVCQDDLINIWDVSHN